MSTYGMAGNGRVDKWYVEIEEALDTGDLTLIVEHRFGNQLFSEPITEESLDDLIAALQQLKKDAFE